MKALAWIAFMGFAGAAQQALAYGEPDPGYTPTQLTQGSVCRAQLTLLGDQGALVSVGFLSASGIDDKLARLRADGALETGWGSGGIAAVPGVSGFIARTVFRHPDGGFLLVGTHAIKFRADGTLDTGYGTDGVSDVFDIERVARGQVAMTPEGAVISMYSNNATGSPRWTFTRIGPDGKRDPAFGENGYIRLPVDANAIPYAWGLQRDGQLQYAIARLEAQGVPLPELHRYPNDFQASEGLAGRLVPRDAVATWVSPSAKVDAQGRLLLASGGCTGVACPEGKLRLTRFDASGRPDAAFGTGGSVLAATGSSHGQIQTFSPHVINLGADGSITIILSHSSNTGFFSDDQAMRVVRFSDAGVLDPQFASAPYIGSALERVALDDSGRILMTTFDKGCVVKRYLGDQPRASAQLVEYRYRDRYFITAEGPESALLDNDPAAEKLRRTGQVIGGWLPASQPPASLPLCRFAGDRVAGPIGHFYSLQGAECDLVRADDERLPVGTRTWRFEGLAFNETATSAAGACAANLQPVYRLYNDAVHRGGEPNHRFATNPAVISEMQSKGWVLEGVAFCAPPATR